MASAQEFLGKVVAVLDGDTVLVARASGQSIKVRLAGIDAPERAQEYGAASSKSLQEMVLNKQVQVSSKAVDDHGRLVAEVSASGLNVNREQVRRGMAWNYSRSHSDRELAALQHEAQQARRGLWAGESVIKPSQWRKQHPSAPRVVPSPAVVADPDLRPSSGQALRPGSGQACSKKRCAEMASCEEAKYYLTHCHVQTLDGDGDGVPCERLCAATK